jgi:hypothetical protein
LLTDVTSKESQKDSLSWIYFHVWEFRSGRKIGAKRFLLMTYSHRWALSNFKWLFGRGVILFVQWGLMWNSKILVIYSCSLISCDIQWSVNIFMSRYWLIESSGKYNTSRQLTYLYNIFFRENLPKDIETKRNHSPRFGS